MEGRICNLLLSGIAAVLTLSSFSLYAVEIENEQSLASVIQPQIERMDFEESRINPDDFEIIASMGVLSIEDFGVNSVYGLKFSYRVSEGFFVDTEFAASRAGKTSAEELGNGDIVLLTDEERNLSYYTLNLGYDLFPGESFVTDKLTYNTALYVIAGLGNTQFAGGSNFTFSWGFGYRIMFASFMTMYFDVRDHRYTVSTFKEKLTSNIEVSLGLGFVF